MVFVTLGTQDKEFKRLLEHIDLEIEKGTIKEKVVVQKGNTKYESKNMELYDFLDREEYEKFIKECSVLITHGGVGSILTGIQYGKIVIAVPRLSKYKEHVNNHQVQIVESFSNSKYILGLKDLSLFSKVYEKSRHFKPKKFESHTEEIIKKLEDYIDNL